MVDRFVETFDSFFRKEHIVMALAFMLLFLTAGIGNGSVFHVVPNVFRQLHERSVKGKDQAAQESADSLMPTLLAGANFIMHSAGWLEGGLVMSYEKFMLDVDHLKEYNERFGHLRGSQVLKSLAGLMERACGRAGEVVTRFGGEEFAVLLPRTDLDAAAALAERLRSAVEMHRVIHEDIPIQTTISLGVAAWSEDMADGEEMTRAADLALYQAKQQGRNRVVVTRDEAVL